MIKNFKKELCRRLRDQDDPQEASWQHSSICHPLTLDGRQRALSTGPSCMQSQVISLQGLQRTSRSVSVHRLLAPNSADPAWARFCTNRQGAEPEPLWPNHSEKKKEEKPLFERSVEPTAALCTFPLTHKPLLASTRPIAGHSHTPHPTPDVIPHHFMSKTQPEWEGQLSRPNNLTSWPLPSDATVRNSRSSASEQGWLSPA